MARRIAPHKPPRGSGRFHANKRAAVHGLVLVALWATACNETKETVETADVTPPTCGPLDLVQLTAGSFSMGSPDDEVGRRGDEARHTVTLTRAFSMGVHEVTQGEFEACMGENPSTFATAGADFPVENVSWYDAAAFANALSDAEGRDRCYACSDPGTNTVCDPDPAWTTPYDCTGYRLPTEAEWEYAARAGANQAFANGGNLLPDTPLGCDQDVVLDNGAYLGDLAWYCGSSEDTSHAVGLLQPNAWGLYDVSGNVWEWVADGYDLLPLDAVTDPYVFTGSFRVDRGGSWYDGVPPFVRSAMRGGSVPSARSAGLGFRVARTAEPTQGATGT